MLVGIVPGSPSFMPYAIGYKERKKAKKLLRKKSGGIAFAVSFEHIKPIRSPGYGSDWESFAVG